MKYQSAKKHKDFILETKLMGFLHVIFIDQKDHVVFYMYNTKGNSFPIENNRVGDKYYKEYKHKLHVGLLDFDRNPELWFDNDKPFTRVL